MRITRLRSLAAICAPAAVVVAVGAALPAHAFSSHLETEPPPAKSATIEQVQGAAQVSPLAGADVTQVAGVVTVLGPHGFWMESATPDDDPATSEGLYVFTARPPRVAVGDVVSVDARVDEYAAGGSSTPNLTQTELEHPRLTVRSSGNPLPAPVVIGVDRLAPAQQIYAGDPGSIGSTSVAFDPARNATDFDESLEGMLVSLRQAKAVGPTNAYGETPVVPGQHVHAVRTRHGGVVYSGYNLPNSTHLILSIELLPPSDALAVNVGDRFEGSTTGVMTYGFGNFQVDLTAAPTVSGGGLQREVTATPTPAQLAVATFNVENLAPSDSQAKFDRLAGQIVHNLQAPDLVVLEEIQDDSGTTDDGTVDSSQTSDKLIAAITAAGGPAYQARWIDPVNDQDGGQPGGNIRQVYLFRTDRGLAVVDTPGGDSTTPDTVVGTGSGTHLAFSPGRVDPASSAWADSRKPLAGEFTFHGHTVFVIANHLISKLGDDPMFGSYQQPRRASEVQRHQQAQEIRDFVRDLLAANRSADVVVLGDMNDFQFSQTADIMAGWGTTALLDLPRTLPLREQYTYDYEGNSEVLDQILISRNLAHRGAHPGYTYDIVHTNAGFADQDSDHDPQVVRLRLPAGGGPRVTNR